MRCFSCARLSIEILCEACCHTLFVPSIHKRKIGTLDVISFFPYTTLESLLHTKHKPEGYRIYKKLGTLFFKPFIQTFVEESKNKIYTIGIDEHVEDGYSHVAQLTHAMRHYAKPLHATLISKSKVKYSGKNMQYRREHPRKFHYTGKSHIDAILVDDIVTTGITLQEAQKVLEGHHVNVLFALTLAEVERKK